MALSQVIAALIKIHFILSEYTKGMRNIGKEEESF